MRPDRLPASIAFCDVETTGLGNHDRIVSLVGGPYLELFARERRLGWDTLGTLEGVGR